MGGFYGYICYLNDSKLLLKQQLTLKINGFEVAWPEQAIDNQEFLLETKPEGGSDLILLRKSADQNNDDSTMKQDHISTYFPPLEGEETSASSAR